MFRIHPLRSKFAELTLSNYPSGEESMPSHKNSFSVPELVEHKDKKGAEERLKLHIVDFETEINKINCEALESSRRMVDVVEEINEEGMETIAALEDQDEQLDKIQDNLYKITDDMSRVRRDIRKMEVCCCFPFRKLFGRKRSVVFRTSRQLSKREDSEVSQSATSSLVVRHSFNKQKPPLYTKRLTEDVIDEEIEKNLIQVDTTLESIRHLAIDIDIQLRIQEPKIEEIQTLVENNDYEMDGAQEKVKKLLT